MSYKVLSSSSPEGLTLQVNLHIEDGYVPTGGVVANITRQQNRYSGSQHMDTINKIEYIQSVYKNEKQD